MERLSASWSVNDAVMEYTSPEPLKWWEPANSINMMVIANLVEYPVPLCIFFPVTIETTLFLLAGMGLASPGLMQLSKPQGNSDSLGLLGSVVLSHLQQLFLAPEVTSGGTLTKLWSVSGSLILILLPGPVVASTSTLGHPGRMPSL